MTKFAIVAMGGTFDIIHKGHTTLLSNAFDVSDNVIIGLTSDEFAAKKGKIPINNYDQRFENLTNVISKEFPNKLFEISKLENDFGPAVLKKEVEALIVSDETSNQGQKLNELRAQKNLPPVQIVTVPMFLAKDGTRISTTRIKNSEIDADGNLLSIDK
ncbi:phosphopantetheine adenylyltransferase [Nitrosopumilus sp.]|uniref:phosphopantetheine adenylyltransferase n=1 Tax=Nitrosopumilus sp. TaxID=2024843 RepID=UPI00247B3AD2|nr:pantetheine-phosphate adenylyltransferase [Nitrosopumilus sp.]MCV0431070.1 pantetheine-phosphate adenylyltransferase [Nitrosopumilus sp.]